MNYGSVEIKMSNKKYKDILVGTVIGSETELKGTIQSQNSIRIDGQIEGEVYSQGEVHIGETSIIKGNIYAKRVIISGEVNGNIEATQGLKISKTGRVYGDITGDRLIVEEGGTYKGRVNMDVVSTHNLLEGDVEYTKGATY